mgnify:CR=1 FL=1
MLRKRNERADPELEEQICLHDLQHEPRVVAGFAGEPHHGEAAESRGTLTALLEKTRINHERDRSRW